MNPLRFPSVVLSLALSLASTVAQIAPPASGELVQPAELDAAAFKTENDASVTITGDGAAKAVQFTYPASKSYPGINFPSPAGGWDLSAFRGVEVDVVNNGPAKVGISMRAENPGDWQKSPWNANVLWLAPGSEGTLTVTFGESFGHPGYELDPSAVSAIKVFLNTPSEAGEVILKNLRGVAK